MSAAVEAHGISVKFGTRTIVQDLSFELPAGSFLALVGPNGSGKTTLLRVFLGLLNPDSGTALVLGKPPTEHDRASIGYVPQVKTLDRSFPGKSVELVATAFLRGWPWRLAPEVREKAVAALARVGAQELADLPINRLSGGELQRVYLARALAQEPRLLLLDEPATGVDLAGEQELNRILDECHRAGTTILMVTHDWSVALHHTTHTLLLKPGLVQFGASHEVLTEVNLRAVYGHAGHAHGMLTGGHEHD